MAATTLDLDEDAISEWLANYLPTLEQHIAETIDDVELPRHPANDR